MRANIVLAGGGAKGAVLAGCLKAAEDKGIVPVGFGGTSAGSIVATLAAIGYSGEEMKEILIEKDFAEFLEDRGKILVDAKASLTRLFERLRKRSWFTIWSLLDIARYVDSSLGLYQGRFIKDFLVDRLKHKFPDFKGVHSEITFLQLKELGCKPLRIVATDLLQRRAVIFGNGKQGESQRIVDAVAASACFPFVFQPRMVDGMLLSDGGLSSNLPSFLFEDAYLASRTQTLAFDLIEPIKPKRDVGTLVSVKEFFAALLGIALEASDVLLREATPGVMYFGIQTPEGINTLDFSLTRAQRDACFSKGYSQTAEKLEKHEPLMRTRKFGEQLKRRLMIHFGPPRLYEPVLRAAIQQLEFVSADGLKGCRANIMILTGRSSDSAQGTRIIMYAVGMEKDPDRDLEIDQDAGCSGKAWETGQIAVADLDEARRNPDRWKMSADQTNKVPPRLKSMISIAICGDVRDGTDPSSPIGTLSIDCETPLANTGWCTQNVENAGPGGSESVEVSPPVATVLTAWATIIGRMMP
jgi:NTE family protein